jgi:hypothetical protein
MLHLVLGEATVTNPEKFENWMGVANSIKGAS